MRVQATRHCTKGKLLRLTVLLLLCGASREGVAQQVVDRVLMVVNGEVVTRTDLVWGLALDPQAPSPAGRVDSDTLRRKLDVMIDQRLIAQEASRIPTTEITQEEVEKKRSQLIASFPNETAFRQRVESVGLTPERLDELLRERVLVDRFIDFRFRSFVFVSEQDIQRYYDEQLAPELRGRGVVPPPIKDLRERIIALLREEKVNQELDRWLAAARQRAELVVVSEP